jgi:hypothetical protein
MLELRVSCQVGMTFVEQRSLLFFSLVSRWGFFRFLLVSYFTFFFRRSPNAKDVLHEVIK